MKVLVTGACGFIGSHLAEALVKEGHEVKALTYYNSFNSYGWLDHSPLAKHMEIVPGDVRDAFCVREAVRGRDVVYHLAALIGIPYSYLAPGSYVETNVVGTLNVVQAVRDFSAKLVHASTSEVYGSAISVPISEEHPLQGQSPYSATKIGADQLAMSYYLSFGTQVSIVRPFNTYGPRQSSRAVIPTIITQLLAGSRRIKLGAVHTSRDFNFVSDTVRGFMSAGASDGGIGTVINLGSGFEITIGDTLSVIASLMNMSAEPEQDAQRVRPPLSEVERLCADNRKAQRLIGWSPLHRDLEGFKRGLSETIEWFANPANAAKSRVDEYVV